MPHVRLIVLSLLIAALAGPLLAQDATDPSVKDDAARQDDAGTRQFDFANGLYIRGKAFYGQAAEQYQIFLRDHPDDARCDEALFRLGECYRNDGKPEEALSAYEEHAKRFAAGANAVRRELRRGQVLHELGKLNEAIAVFRALAEGDNAGAEFKEAARYRLARALFDAKQTDEALKVFNTIADDAQDRFRPYALYQLGLTHDERGEADLAVTRFGQLAKLGNDFAPEALFRVGEIEFKREQYDKAASAYRAVAEQNGKTSYGGAAAYGLVQSLLRTRKYEDAIAAHGKLKDLVPEPVRPQTDYLVGNAHYELGQYDTAFKFYETAAKAAPGSELAARAEVKMAWCRYFLKDYKGLVTAATAFLNEHPQAADADTVHYLAGEALLQLGRPQDALMHYQTIVVDFPRSGVLVETEFKIGWCLFAKKDYEEARKTFLAFADNHGADARAPEAVARAAECAVADRRMTEAAADYERLLESYPDSPLAEGALYQLGLAQVSLDEQDKAVETFLRFTEKYPKSAYASDAYYWIGSQRQKAGQLDEAVTFLTRSVETAHDEKFVERANYKLATIHHERSEFDQAAAILLAMLKKNAKADVPPKTHLWAAGYLLEQKQFADAKVLYEAFLKKFTAGAGLDEAHFGLGECLTHEKQWAAALDHYTKADVEGGSLRLLARLRSGVCLHMLSRDDKAVEVLSGLIGEENASVIESAALYWLGTVHFLQARKAKDPAKAVELYKEAQNRFQRVHILYGNAEERPECMLRVAQCLAATGQPDEAAKYYRELIEEYPDSPFAADAQKALGTDEQSPPPG
ncbi:MAG: tetratricopeptide repeat protein [Verrucomicrobia bacterium]|nr:tetratricopeptide repeat protein [Verrucomicrobiota bacterium]